jgi:hypothetical protein
VAAGGGDRPRRFAATGSGELLGDRLMGLWGVQIPARLSSASAPSAILRCSSASSSSSESLADISWELQNNTKIN